jgi:hypothetical protein
MNEPDLINAKNYFIFCYFVRGIELDWYVKEIKKKRISR